MAVLLPVGLLSFQKWSDESASREAKESAKVDFQTYHTYSNDESGRIVGIQPLIEKTGNNISYADVKKTENIESSFLIQKEGTTDVVAVSKSGFKKGLKQMTHQAQGCEYGDIMQGIKYLITEITGRGYTWDGGVSWRMYPTNDPSAGDRQITAFAKSISLDTLRTYKDADSDQNVIRNEGLRLKLSNVSLKKVFLTSFSCEAPPIYFYVEANADVNTKKKPDQFKDKWIPAVGEEKNVDLIFVVEYYPEEMIIPWSIKDIAVKGYN